MENEIKRLMDISELMEYLGVGRNMAIEFGRLSNSRCKIGRRVLFDRKRVDNYLDNLVENQNHENKD